VAVEAAAFHLEEAQEEEAYPGWVEVPAAEEVVPRNFLDRQMGALVVVHLDQAVVLRIAALEA
jgi:hypothetical protein